MKNTQAFTLIELLVVVLIIGILAAVALPQYQKAVEKSRFAAFIPLVKAVANAKSEYYLATGEHARTFDVLSIELPKEFTITDDSEYGQAARAPKRIIRLDASDARVVGNMFFSDGSQILYYVPISEVSSTKRCAGTPNKRGEEFCKSLKGAIFRYADNGYNWYTLPD